MTTKHLNTVATRIQTRLSRKGLKVALGEIKDYLIANAGNIENITDVEVNTTTDYFMTNATQLTVISENETAPTEELVISGEDAIATAEDITTSPNQETSICEGAEIGNIQPAITEETETLPLSSELTHTTQSQLITTTADQMGIVLDASEISLIAENINDSTDTLEQDIDAIRSAIIAFVKHKAMVNQSKINSMIQEVREVVGEKNQENSQLLSDGLKSINNDIQEANKQFKSNVKKALTAFNIPSLKAG